MNNKNHKRAKILTLIPAIVFAITAACIVPLTISYFSTGSDVTAVALIFIGSLILILTTLPCLVLAIIGTAFAARAKNEGIAASRKFLVIGIIEIIVYGPGVLCAIVAAIFSMIAAARW